MARAVASSAGLSRKLRAWFCDAKRERTSRSNSASLAQACFRNASRSPGGNSCTASSSASTCFQRSGPIHAAAQFAVEPGFGDIPVAHYRDGRDLEHFRRLFYAEAAKKAHLHHLHFTLIDA